ncbi:hypothetical protein L484_009162 [Morus notabilis]|uniref:Uncharacterized protein n=1 Tax=Morus notabilis TaxID=981085 RepID=W9RK88_9ROSA|nr:hypothetical protein L484_009162 [Morus notabilis]
MGFTDFVSENIGFAEAVVFSAAPKSGARFQWGGTFFALIMSSIRMDIDVLLMNESFDFACAEGDHNAELILSKIDLPVLFSNGRLSCWNGRSLAHTLECGSTSLVVALVGGPLKVTTSPFNWPYVTMKTPKRVSNAIESLCGIPLVRDLDILYLRASWIDITDILVSVQKRNKKMQLERSS